MQESPVDTNNDCEIMTPKQVAEYLQISTRTVYSCWKELGGLRVGRTIRFRKEVINALFRPDEKTMEGGGKKRRKKIHKSVSNKDRSKTVGNNKEERIKKSGSGKSPNRHGLADGLQQVS